MSEDRLEKALQAMKVKCKSEQLSEAGARVRQKWGIGSGLCSEFQSQFRTIRRAAQRSGGCCWKIIRTLPSCRAQFARERGEQNVFRCGPSYAWPKWATWAAAAAVRSCALHRARQYRHPFRTGRPRATVASSTGGLFLVSEAC